MAETKTSSSCWITQLRLKLTPLVENRNFRLAVLGIGNQLNGDDSAGIWAARKLQATLKDRSNIFIMDCGSIPENATGPLRRFKPQLILMIDAADLDEKAGTIRFIELDQVRGFSASSHTLPLSVLAGFMEKEFQCETALLGIQPLDLTFGKDLSTVVSQSVERIVKEILTLAG